MMTETPGIKFRKLQEIMIHIQSEEPSLDPLSAAVKAIATQLVVERECSLPGLGKIVLEEDEIYGNLFFNLLPTMQFKTQVKEGHV